MKEKKYRTEYPKEIEVCRNCQGRGKTLEYSLFHGRGDTCPVCEGSGRIIKTKTVIITIEPYASDDTSVL